MEDYYKEAYGEELINKLQSYPKEFLLQLLFDYSHPTKICALNTEINDKYKKYQYDKAMEVHSKKQEKAFLILRQIQMLEDPLERQKKLREFLVEDKKVSKAFERVKRLKDY